MALRIFKGPEFQNLNVKLTMWYTFFLYLSRGMYNQNILSAYIYILTDGSNTKIGLVTGLRGLVQVLIGPLCGYFADKYKRAIILRIAGVLGLIAAVIMIVALWIQSYTLLCIAGMSWGLFGGVSNSSVEALFADSVPNGSRSKVFSYKSALTKVANAAGPALSLILFLILGDKWTSGTCLAALTVGLALSAVPSALLFFLHDRHALTAAAAATGRSESKGSTQADLKQPLLEDESQEDTEEDEADDSSCAAEEDVLPASKQVEAISGQSGRSMLEERSPSSMGKLPTSIQDSNLSFKPKDSQYTALGKVKYSNYIPAMVVTGDILAGIASGMSIKFFPIFFKQNLSLSPVEVQTIYIFSNLLTSLTSIVAQRFSKRAGRGVTILLSKGLGISFLVMICLLSYYGFERAGILGMVFVFRTALMNGTKALSRSIIMDQVPKRHRAKWSSLEAFNTASWSGSAFLGGVLVDRAGILNNFYVTSALQACALVPVFTLTATGKIPREGN